MKRNVIFILAILITACSTIPTQVTVTSEMTVTLLPASTPKATATHTLEFTSTPTETIISKRVFTDAKLEEMAIRVKDELPFLVRNKESYVAYGDASATPNFFEYNGTTEDKNLIELTQILMDIVFSGRADLIAEMNVQPYVINMPDSVKTTQELPLLGGYEINKSILESMEQNSVMIGFPGTVTPNGEKVRINEIYPQSTGFAYIVEDGKININEGFGSFDDEIGVTFGAKMKTWVEISKLNFVAGNNSALAVMEYRGKPKKIHLYTLPNGNIGYNSILVVLGDNIPEDLGQLLQGSSTAPASNAFDIQMLVSSELFQ